jgi:hypothetical protein
MATYSVSCSICHTLIGSLLLDPKQGISEVSNNFATHLANIHPKELLKMQKDMAAVVQLAAWYILMQYVDFHEGKDKLDEAFEANGMTLLKLLGMEEGELAPPGPEPAPPIVLVPKTP